MGVSRDCGKREWCPKWGNKVLIPQSRDRSEDWRSAGVLKFEKAGKKWHCSWNIRKMAFEMLLDADKSHVKRVSKL